MRAAEIIAQRTVRQDKDSFGTLITIDPDGSPVPTTISPSRSEGISWITFCTGKGAPSPVRLGQNNKAAVQRQELEIKGSGCLIFAIQ